MISPEQLDFFVIPFTDPLTDNVSNADSDFLHSSPHREDLLSVTPCVGHLLHAESTTAAPYSSV